METGGMTWNEVLRIAADAYLNGTATDPTTLGDILAELESIDTTLSTPATSIPHFATDATSDLTRAYDDGSTAAEESLVAATASQTTRVYSAKVSAAGACFVRLLNGSAGTELCRWTFPAAGAYDEAFDPRPIAVTGANTALYWERSAAVACTIEIRYIKSV
jgi:hypothetical protein